jgi:hypothetical protein
MYFEVILILDISFVCAEGTLLLGSKVSSGGSTPVPAQSLILAEIGCFNH